MNSSDIQIFKTKKQVKEAGFRTRDEWFRKFRVPFPSANPTIVKSTEYFSEVQTEELYFLSKGQKEIGPLREGSEAIGVKRLPRRSVRYKVFRESDFVFEPKNPRNIKPPQSIDLITAILKLDSTAKNYDRTSKNPSGKSSRRVKKGFRKRAAKLRELVDVGLKMAINRERISLKSSRRGWFTYQVGDRTIKSRVKPPEWFAKEKDGARPTRFLEQIEGSPKCRLVDAIFTIERFTEDPTIK